MSQNESATRIAQLEAQLAAATSLRDTAEEHRDHYDGRVATGIASNPITIEYWRGRRDEAGYFRDQLDKVIDSAPAAVGEQDNYAEAVAFHPRAMKLIGKRKNFIVIADDEPYYFDAYRMIRRCEVEKGTWTPEDEQIFKDTFPRQFWEMEHDDIMLARPFDPPTTLADRKR